jgi:WD40 repeat protein
MRFFSPILSIVILVCMKGFAPAQAPPRLEPFIQTGHTQRITSVVLSADGKLALTGSWDKTAILWQTASGKKLQTFQGTVEVASVALTSLLHFSR